MKKKRGLPFGYTVQNGRLIIQEDEAEIVRGIFQAYIGGSSMLELADLMTKREIPYTEKRMAWNKNIIARMITDRRYAGTDGFEPIIDDQDFREAEICKQNRRTKPLRTGSNVLEMLRGKVFCASCQSDMIRIYEGRNRQKVCWRCLNGSCGLTVKYLNDEILPSRITDILNTLIENPDILTSGTETVSVRKIRDRTATEFAKLIDDNYSTEDQILDALRRNIASAYESLPLPMEARREQIKALFRKAAVSQNFQTDLFSETVDKIYLHEDGSVTLLLKDGSEI